MKRNILIAGLILVSSMAFAQKKEIKKAEKAIKSGDLSEAVNQINMAEALIGSADAEVKTQFYIVKAEAYLADAGTGDFAKMKTAAEALMTAKESDGGKFTERIDIGRQNLRTALVNSAVADQNSQNYADAAKKLYTSYSISTQDTSDLYYAAGNAINAQDYDAAVEYYQKLLDLGYTGIRKQYLAVDVESGEVVSFRTENERNTNMLTGLYSQPSEKTTSSVQGDILTNMTLIYMTQGNNDKALELMKKARAANPDDISLIRSEADMAYKMGDLEKYNSLMKEVIATDPNNPELYYNLGVGSAQNGDNEAAMEYYTKAIELDAEYANAKINMAALLLADEGKIVEEMNNLGTSAADNKKYDELKEKRKQLYLQAAPYLESAIELRPDNKELVRTLMNIYSQVGEDAKFKALKARLATMEEGGK